MINLEAFQKLYEFGGMMAYQVVRFDPVMFRVETDLATFSEEAAKRRIEQLKEMGVIAGIESQLIRFDGVFDALSQM